MCFSHKQYSVWCTSPAKLQQNITLTQMAVKVHALFVSETQSSAEPWSSLKVSAVPRSSQMSSWLPLVSCAGSGERKSTLSTVSISRTFFSGVNDSDNGQSGSVFSKCRQFTYKPSTQLLCRHSIHVHLLWEKINSFWAKLGCNTFHAFWSRVRDITPTKSTYCIESQSQCLVLEWCYWQKQRYTLL